MTNKNTPAVVSDADFQAAFLKSGLANRLDGGSEFNRITAKGQNLVYNKEVIASYNAKTKEPALLVQLTDMPVEYQAMWFTAELAEAVGRPEVANRFCKSHFDDPAEAREWSEAYGEEGKRQNCRTCPVNPFKKPGELPPEAKAQEGASKCAWKGDIEFRIIDQQEDGTFASTDETVYTMTLPTTGIIEFKGSNSRKADPMAGSVSAEHFMVKLAKMGMSKWGLEDGLKKAQESLQNGGVIAALRIPMKDTQDGSKSYSIVSFDPIEILEVEAQAQLPEPEAKALGTAEDTEDGDATDLPF